MNECTEGLSQTELTGLTELTEVGRLTEPDWAQSVDYLADVAMWNHSSVSGLVCGYQTVVFARVAWRWPNYILHDLQVIIIQV